MNESFIGQYQGNYTDENFIKYDHNNLSEKYNIILDGLESSDNDWAK